MEFSFRRHTDQIPRNISTKTHTLPGLVAAYAPFTCSVEVSDSRSVLQFQSDFDRHLWPYPVEQLEWLSRNAHHIMSNIKLYEYIRYFSQNPEPLLGNGIYFPEIVCRNHKKICSVQDQCSRRRTLYSQLKGLRCCFVASCLLQIKNPDVEAPPYPLELGVIRADDNGCMFFRRFEQ
ncbi:hypothetical protein BV898_04870 [Hypsibius exemplaris]|uniref:Uncharacterized protein n=1 Tax=Hypsibius exemplaris TaxID=2072580 RepID=A0A1W0X0Y8_HYPEX|nr:hypothetical protein BV898_04870 [Hypsibius exemplaris]